MKRSTDRQINSRQGKITSNNSFSYLSVKNNERSRLSGPVLS
ncbi:MAG: hypothetical protein J07HX5_01531 [halophilic archaeon J07HX5]|nr:MAG: hypothetical protein J07HX5_01531 [halophilic archaeon J07HX5]